MQSLRIVFRQIGAPNKALDVFSGSEAAEYIEYQYLSQGYRVQSSHFLGEVKNEQGKVQGYKMLFVLTKDEAGLSGDVGEKQAVASSTDPRGYVEVPAKRGRPKKVS